MSSGNDYNSQNQQDGLSPPPFNPNSPNPSHSATQPPTGRLNDLTLEELLDSPRRQSLQRLDPNRPPGTLLDFKEPHASWTQTPESVINRWYETFAQMYNWDRSINQRVRDEFEDKLKDRMCDQISRWKGKWKNNGDEAKPKWIDPQVWAELVRFWRDPKSEIKNINSRNARYHDPYGQGIFKHRSGQTSFKSCARKHSEETGDSTPYFLVVLEQTHRKADGTFIDRKSEEINKEVSSRIEEEESQLCSGDNTESSASGRNEGCMGLVLCQHEVSSVNVGPPPTHNDPVVLSENLAAAEARLQSQAEKIHSFDAYFEYLAEKDIVFGGMYRGGFETENGNATRTAEDNGTRADQTGTETGTGTIPGSSPSQAF
ncbi:putative transposase Ptta/En/Spm plant [Arabidopsis thaliana x Arabidopsis arenosa]|uniref:Putative transposase Ptta/En/Spm plant n=1 Tax=Arabidopsis thaliana x Arabidopsis arenosa TaxID=1240361 RepID=A0A8T1Y9N4_9BRAS|nr:putative transposase Ptta/En/Spm plant [Arabidopsis thaliana x Arabidopsis arenosa]